MIWLRMCSNKQAVIERKPEADPKTTNVKEDAADRSKAVSVQVHAAGEHGDFVCLGRAERP